MAGDAADVCFGARSRTTPSTNPDAMASSATLVDAREPGSRLGKKTSRKQSCFSRNRRQRPSLSPSASTNDKRQPLSFGEVVARIEHMELSGRALSLENIAAVAHRHESVKIAASARPRISAARKVVDDIIARDAVVYGVNTGFGKLSEVRVPTQ